MKLTGRDAGRYFAKPDPNRTGLLIFGADAMRVALKRQEVIAALIGPAGEEEMRLTRIPAADLRKDAAALLDAVKAISFFPGPRAVFVEDATDALTDTMKIALADWQAGDAQIIVTAGGLTGKSRLKMLFEKHQNAYCAGLYDDPPTREEIEAELARAGLRDVGRQQMDDLTALSRELDPGDFRQTLEKLSLYKLEDDAPLSSADILACAPTSTEADLDDVLNIVAEGKDGEIGPVMGRLKSQGTNAVSLCIGATRHFRTLYAAASHPGGASQGIAAMRPPIFGARRDRMQRQAQAWGAAKLEIALTLLTDTDLKLRSAGRTVPDMALVERTLIRLSMMGKRR